MGMDMVRTVNISFTTAHDLWPYRVVEILQRVMEQGEKKGKSGWQRVSMGEHMDKAHDHLAEARESYDLDIPKSEDHLAHAFTRLMMAIAIRDGYVKKEGNND